MRVAGISQVHAKSMSLKKWGSRCLHKTGFLNYTKLQSIKYTSPPDANSYPFIETSFKVEDKQLLNSFTTYVKSSINFLAV